jgi:hypothetical protein
MFRLAGALLLSLNLLFSGASEAAPRAAAKKAAPAAAARRPASAAPAAKAQAKPQAKPPVDTRYKVRAPAASAYVVGNSSGGMASIGGVAESDKAIQVMGQARNLSMMLTLRNEKDRIKFVEVRRHFRPEISQTQY